MGTPTPAARFRGELHGMAEQAESAAKLASKEGVDDKSIVDALEQTKHWIDTVIWMFDGSLDNVKPSPFEEDPE